MITEAYRVIRWDRANRKTNPTEESGEITGPDAWGMALRLADQWAQSPVNRSVNILRADLTGVNAGKFFLHRIHKAR